MRYRRGCFFGRFTGRIFVDESFSRLDEGPSNRPFRGVWTPRPLQSDDFSDPATPPRSSAGTGHALRAPFRPNDAKCGIVRARVTALGERFLPHAAVGPIQLKPAQQRAVAALTADPESDLTRGQYEQLAGVSRSQAAYDLAELVEAGILDRLGKGRATRYRLARGGGSQRHWTDERIRAELAAFCAGRETWPSPADFKAAGRGDLYVAASRYGGIAHWTEALGFSRSIRDVPAPARSPLRTKLKWAGAGALVALSLAAAGAIFINLDGHGASPSTQAAEPPARAVPNGVSDESMHSLPAAARKARTAPARARHAPRYRRQLVHARAKTSSAAVETSTTSSVSGSRTFSAYTPTPQNWPTPLPAPSGGSAPPPLKAP